MSPQEIGPRTLHETLVDTNIQIAVLRKMPELVFEYGTADAVTQRVDELCLIRDSLVALLPQKPTLGLVQTKEVLPREDTQVDLIAVDF